MEREDGEEGIRERWGTNWIPTSTPPPAAVIAAEVSRDPLSYLEREIRTMDVNAAINTGVVVLVTVAVLSKIATVDMGITRGWTTDKMAARAVVDNWLSYSAVLEHSPVSTKAVTSATVYTIGDALAQRTEGATMGELGRPRILRSLLAGLIGHGPLSHVWFDLARDSSMITYTGQGGGPCFPRWCWIRPPGPHSVSWL